MSGRRQLERRMRREGKDAFAAEVPQAEFRKEAMAMTAELLPVLFKTQPVAPLVCLLALEVARRHVVLMVDEMPLSEQDRARFWQGVEHEMKAYDDALQARRS